MNLGTTLITGASSGIGLHMAHQFAAHGHSLILVAPQKDELCILAEELRLKYDAEVYVMSADLEQQESAEQIYDEVSDLGLDVDVLVNNAGHGHRGKSWEIPIEKDLSILRLNVEA